MGNNLAFLFVIVLALFAYLGWLHRTREPDEFHTDNRRVGAFRTATSIFTVVGAPHFAFVTALAYMGGWWVVAFYVGSFCGFLILCTMARRIRTYIPADAHSFPDVASATLGRGAALALSTIGLLFLLGVVVTQLVLGATLLASVSGFNYELGVVLIAASVLLYLIWGGYRALLFTDAIQAIMMLVLTTVVAWYLWRLVDLRDLAMGQHSQLIVPLIPMLWLAGIILELGAPQNWQRILTAKSDAAAVRSLWSGGLLIFVWGALVVTAGNAIAAILPGANPPAAFVELVTTGLPAWMIGLIVVLLLAALTSTADSALFVGAIVGQKEGNRFAGKPAAGLTIGTTRVMLAVLSAIAALGAVLLSNVVNTFGVLLNLGFVLGPLSIAVALKRGGRKLVVRRGVFFGALLVALAMFVWVWLWVGDFFTWWSLLIIVPSAIPLLLPKGDDSEGIIMSPSEGATGGVQ